MTLLRVLAGAAIALTASASPGQQPTFRSVASTVVVDVSVTTRDGKEVPGLSAADFRLRDNGVAQTITRVSRQELPIDLTIVADISGQTEGPLLDSFRRAIDDVLARLTPADRASLLLFDPAIREVDGFERSRLSIHAEYRPSAGNATALVDAVAMGLVRSFDPARRRMLVVFSDGQDAGSFLDEADLLDVAARSGVTIFAVAVTDGTARTPQPPANMALLTALAGATGGVVEVVQRDQDIGGPFTRSFEAFRTSYVLQYTPATVEGPGWHELEVDVARGGRYTVRARKGYFGAGTSSGAEIR